MYMEREKECLRTLDHLRHPNIVRLLSSYTHRGNHCFLFPLFDMDLARFLQLKQRFGDFEKDFTFYTALQGLSSALVKVHSLNLNTRDHDTELERIGYHHDIRPANILVDSRTFYLADFGLAKMKPGDAKSETDWITGLGDYVGPECRNEQDLQRSRVGRPLDIWSFGCMLSEVAANIKGGADGVEKFRKIREGPAARRGMSDTYFFAGGKLRESVITWFEKSKAHDQSKSGVLSGLLEVATLMLKIEPRNRPKASEVHEKLAFLSVKALFDAVQETFTEYLGKAKLQQSDKRTSMTAIQLEIRRLNAWGKVLQLSRNSPLADVDVDVVRTVSQNGDCFRGLLISSLKKLDEYKTIAKAGGAGPSPPAFAFPIHKPLHEGLRELTTALWNSVPTQQLDKLEHEWLQDSLDTDSPETLREIQSGAQSFTHQYTELSAFTLAKRENLLLKSPDIQGTERESLLLDSGVHVEKSFGDYQVGRYEGKQVWIERVFDPPEFEAMPELKRRLRIQRLAEVRSLTPKPTGFCVLDCLFAIPDQKHYDFVYAFPTPQSESPTVPKPTVPTSLSKILEKPRKDVNLSLRESFQLAHKLVNCVWALHTSRWVHKNICSTNVIFFQEGSSALAEELKNPYIVGFRDSRPSEEEWHTKPHAKGSILQYSQHPDYSANDQHFREIYDYYSIGIVLLELGSWAQLEYILRKTPRESKGPAAFRDLLIEKYVPRLSYTMGDTYRDATLACLECSFGSGGVDEDTALRGFYNRVVGPLHQLSGFPI